MLVIAPMGATVSSEKQVSFDKRRCRKERWHNWKEWTKTIGLVDKRNVRSRVGLEINAGQDQED